MLSSGCRPVRWPVNTGLTAPYVWTRLSTMTGNGAGLTASKKLLVAVMPSASVTSTVMVASPSWFAAGVRVIVRFESEPPSTMLLLGMRAWFDEVAATTRSEAGVSASLTWTSIAAVGVLINVDWSARTPMVGGDTVLMAKLQPPAIWPESTGPESKTYKDH